jgi:hypothetical protein
MLEASEETLSEKQTACCRSYAADHILQSIVADLECVDHKSLRRNGRTVRQLVCFLVKKILFSDRPGSEKRHYNVSWNANISLSTIHDEL